MVELNKEEPCSEIECLYIDVTAILYTILFTYRQACIAYQYPNNLVLWNPGDIHIWNILFHHQNNFLHFCRVHCHMVELQEKKASLWHW